MPQTRISTEGHRLLRAIAKASGQSSEEILDRALDLLERRRTLEEINQGYRQLRADADTWAVRQPPHGFLER